MYTIVRETLNQTKNTKSQIRSAQIRLEELREVAQTRVQLVELLDRSKKRRYEQIKSNQENELSSEIRAARFALFVLRRNNSDSRVKAPWINRVRKLRRLRQIVQELSRQIRETRRRLFVLHRDHGNITARLSNETIKLNRLKEEGHVLLVRTALIREKIQCTKLAIDAFHQHSNENEFLADIAVCRRLHQQHPFLSPYPFISSPIAG